MNNTQAFDVAERLRDAVVDIYDAAAISLPSRRLVSEGEVAFDCELLAVQLVNILRGTPGNPIDPITPQRCASVRVADYRIWIVRCVSTPQEDGSPPSVTTIEGYAAPIYTDAWFLTAKMQEAALNGDLGASCDEILIGNTIIHRPEGAFGGVNLALQYQLGGL